jgi:hypothetical protein
MKGWVALVVLCLLQVCQFCFFSRAFRHDVCGRYVITDMLSQQTPAWSTLLYVGQSQLFALKAPSFFFSRAPVPPLSVGL